MAVLGGGLRMLHPKSCHSFTQGRIWPGGWECFLHHGQLHSLQEEHEPKASSKKNIEGFLTAVAVCSRSAEPDSWLLCLLFSVCCYPLRLLETNGPRGPRWRSGQCCVGLEAHSEALS